MRRIVILFEKACDSKYVPCFLVLIAFLFLSLFSWSTSPFFINDGSDSAVFKTMGQALLKGKVIYRDIFDHKGPYLYFINALGQWLISGRVGIFLLQLVAFSIALWYMFRTARLFLKSSSALICLLLALFFYGGHILEGNQCEEWMMYTFCVALYYVSVYFVKGNGQNHPPRYSLVYGLCFGFSFFIRPNDAVAWMGGIMSGVVLWLFINKKYKNLLQNILYFFCGFSVMSLPVLIYFGHQGAIPDMWYGLIGFNQEYSGGIISLAKSCFSGEKMYLLLLLVLFVWLVYDTEYEKILFAITPAFLLAVFFMGRMFYQHYYICFTPFISLFSSFFFLKSRKTYWTIAVFCVVLHFSTYYKGDYSLRPSMMKWNKTGQQAVYDQAKRLFSLIPESQKDSIWNYNLHWEVNIYEKWQSEFSIFCHNGIVPCNKITIGTNDRLESEDLISKHRPLWILFQRSEETSWYERKKPKEDSLFLASHYDVIAQTDTTICNLLLYKRR